MNIYSANENFVSTGFVTKLGIFQIYNNKILIVQNSIKTSDAPSQT